MPDAGGEVLATRVAFLELQDERRLVQEGYELLDEKRMMLATEIMRQLRRHGEIRQSVHSLARDAQDALTSAVEALGFDDLTVQPPQSLDAHALHEDATQFLGIRLLEARLEPPAPGTESAPAQLLPEARACAGAFHLLLVAHAGAAACAGNLRRLAREYRRTERRARALENIVLPEIDLSLRYIEEQLDALDQEEAVRVRNAGKAAAMAGA